MGKRRKVVRLLAGTCLIAGSAGVAQAEVRALNLLNTHTQERASVVFKRDGVYDQKGLQELNRLLRDWRRNEVTRMDPALFDLIWEVYRDTGAREPIHIVCGYRSPATNNMLRSRSRGVAKFSQHMLGKAMDFYLPDVELSTLRATGMKKQLGGVGFYPTSGSPFVHMDTGSVRAWPRMTRDQLVRLFPDGKTAHVPADGSPLPGYQQALADAEARKARGGGSSSGSSSGGGLLAALFGGGSSSSSYSATPGDDDEEAAPAPVRRQQELRQGPLPAAKATVARSDETPPGVDGVPVYRATPKPIQPQVRLAEVEPPPATGRAGAATAAPFATAAGKGSLVGMPIAAPLPRPSPRLAAAQPIPSRYGPAGNEVPPGWVQGPNGKPVEAPQTVALAAEPARGTPIAVPLPQARPGTQLVAAAEPVRGTPIAVTLPRPRPGTRVASLEGANDASQAFAALTGEAADAPVALGYAPAGTPETAGFTTASLPPSARPTAGSQTAALAPDPRVPGEIASRFASPAAPGSAAMARAAAPSAKTDRLAEASAAHLVAGKADRASELRLIDGAKSAFGRDFAQLRHPDQERLAGLLAKPGVALATGFGFGALDDLRAQRFTGPAIVALAVLRTD